MVKFERALPLAFLLCLFILFSGCESRPSPEQDPAAFTADLAAAAASGDGKALDAYQGNTYRLNGAVDALVPGQYILVRCPDTVDLRVYLPQEELEALAPDAVVGLEGTVKEVQREKYGDIIRAEMILEPAHSIGNTFEVTGEVEEISHDWVRNGQDYAAIWDSSVVQDRQINIYLPEGHDVRVGDTLTARGALLAPSNPEEFSIGFIRGRGTPEVFVMPEPDSVEKGAGQ